MLTREAKPTYQTYVKRKKQEGRVPMSRVKWESYVLKTGPLHQLKYKKKHYSDEVKDVLEEHDLIDKDMEEVEAFKKAKPWRGDPITDAELFRRFKLRANPDTRKRMQDMPLADFMIMYKSIMVDEEEGFGSPNSKWKGLDFGAGGEGGKTASAIDEAELRAAVIKLAHDVPELRQHLVPLLRSKDGE